MLSAPFCPRPLQVLAQRQAVLHVLRELGLTQQQLEERVVEVWNKMDQLPAAADVAAAVAAGGAAAEEQASDGEAAAAGHEVEAAADEAAAVVVAGQEVAAAAGEAGAGGGGAACTGGAGAAEEAAAMAAAGSKQQQQQQQQHGTATQPAEQPASLVDAAGSSGLHAAAAAGLLPPAVEALLRSDVRAASYRPTAVATSVLRGQGLAELLAAVEDKVRGGRAGLGQVGARRRCSEGHGADPQPALPLLPLTRNRRSRCVCVQLEGLLAGRPQVSRRRKRSANDASAADAVAEWGVPPPR